MKTINNQPINRKTKRCFDRPKEDRIRKIIKGFKGDEAKGIMRVEFDVRRG